MKLTPIKAEEFYNNEFHPKIVTVVSKTTVIKLMEQYANKVNQGNGKLILDAFYEEYQDELNSCFIYQTTIGEWWKSNQEEKK